MELTEPAEEAPVRGEMVPAPAHEGSANEGGGEAGAEEDLREEVVVLKHLGDRVYGRRGMSACLAIEIRAWFLLRTDPGKSAAPSKCKNGN